MIKRWGQLLLPVLVLAACGRPPGTQPISPSESPVPASPTQPSASIATESLPGLETSPLALPTSTATPCAMPIPTPSGPPVDLYTVEAGETLGGIAYRECGCDVEELMALNHITDPALLQEGQTIAIPVKTDRVGPMLKLLPDSEVVYSPAYLDFDIAAFVDKQGGYLADYRERVNGREHTGAEIIEMVARTWSVGPRLLLALLEYQSGWVTGKPDGKTARNTPLSLGRGGQAGLYHQLSWAANLLNEGYYGYKRNGTFAYTLADRGRALAAFGLNAGTVGIQNVLALTNDRASWTAALDRQGFLRTYETLFGDAHARAIEPLIPVTLTQPELYLPWPGGRTWYLSGGPHGAWFSGSAWAAVDFAPPDVMGHCGVSTEWATAAASGLVLRSSDGQVLVDLDGDGHEQTGWVLFYLHVADEERVDGGVALKRGDRVGHPSCEGGAAESSHLHIARRYNGEWIAADGPVPMVLSGWRPVNGVAEYEGRLVKDTEVRDACECWEQEVNAIVSDNVKL